MSGCILNYVAADYYLVEDELEGRGHNELVATHLQPLKHQTFQ